MVIVYKYIIIIEDKGVAWRNAKASYYEYYLFTNLQHIWESSLILVGFVGLYRLLENEASLLREKQNYGEGLNHKEKFLII